MGHVLERQTGLLSQYFLNNLGFSFQDKNDKGAKILLYSLNHRSHEIKLLVSCVEKVVVLWRFKELFLELQ